MRQNIAPAELRHVQFDLALSFDHDVFAAVQPLPRKGSSESPVLEQLQSETSFPSVRPTTACRIQWSNAVFANLGLLQSSTPAP